MRFIWAGVVLLATGCYVAHRVHGDDAGDGEPHPDDETVGDGGGADGGGSDAGTGDDADADDGRHRVDGGDITEPPCVDEDGDGHPSVDCGGDDCDDGEPTIFPGAPDACGDGRDTNCDDIDAYEGALGSPVLLLEHPPVSRNLYTALLWTGREYLFLWRIFAGDGIYVQRLDGNGKLVGDEVRIRAYESAFDVSWNGSRVGAVWGTGEEGSMSVMFQAFDRLGNSLTDPVPVVTSPDIAIDGSVVYGPRIAAAGDDFFVYWSERDDPGGNTVYLARVDGAGALRHDPVPVGIYRGGDGPRLDLAWSGSEVLTAWATDGSVLVRSFSFELASLGEERRVTAEAPYGTTPQLLWSGSDHLVLWSDSYVPDDDGPVFQSRRSSLGDEISTVTLADPVTGRYRYLHPAVWARDRLAVVWSRTAGAGHELTLSRFETDGTLHGSSIVVPSEHRPDRLYLAWTGGELGFIWSEEESGDGDPTIGYRVWFQRAAFCD